MYYDNTNANYDSLIGYQDAIKSEIKAHIKNDTWWTVAKENMRLIRHKMILKKKIHPDNNEIKKARLVAQGFTQIPGMEFNETFVPVAKLSSIRTVIVCNQKKT